MFSPAMNCARSRRRKEVENEGAWKSASSLDLDLDLAPALHPTKIKRESSPSGIAPADDFGDHGMIQ
jgi:hypothetical protein